MTVCDLALFLVTLLFPILMGVPLMLYIAIKDRKKEIAKDE